MQIKIQTKHGIAFAAALIFGFSFYSTSQLSAQSCTASVDDISFGAVDLSGGGSVDTAVSFSASCTGIPGNRVRLCFNFHEGTGNIDPSADPRYMLKGADQLDYNIYENAARTRIWGSWIWALPPNGRGLIVRLNGSGTGSKTRTVYSTIKAGQAGAAPGIYLSSFSGSHTTVRFAYRFVGNCNFITGLGGGFQVPFTVSAEVLGACLINTTDLNFGSEGILGSNVDTTNNISVQCSTGVAYTIGLSNGSSGGSGPTSRLMASGPNNVTYGIYSNAGRSVPWGDNIGTNTVAGVGNGTAQSFTGYGRVPPQTTPQPGTYNDTITVTVTY